MQSALADLLNRLEDSADPTRQRVAATEIALFVELKYRPVNVVNDPEFYEGWVPAELRAIQLTEEEEKELLEALGGLALSDDAKAARSGILKALGVGRPRYAIKPIVQLCRHLDGFTEEEARQLLFSLDNALDVLNLPAPAAEEQGASHVALVVRLYDPRALLESLATGENRRVAEAASIVQGKIDKAFALLGAS